VFGRQLSALAVVGLVVGFGGVALLVRPGGGIDVVAALTLVGTTSAWAAGSLYARGADLPESPLQAAAMQMLAAAVLLGAFGALTGETGRIGADSFAPKQVGAFAYLVVVGSLVGFTAYVWLLRVAPISLVATYAYVNPVIAVLLGWALLDEVLETRILLAGAAIVAAVALIVSAPAPERALGRGVFRRSRPADEPGT
ncbi:MAG: EamA family transporter, partial [Actinomycetota bacterium]|nr:EamA family transporter [Actinomycetota bacterium]